jgi:hypothetical protein
MIRQSLVFRKELRDAIKSEVAQRTQIHQSQIAALRALKQRLLIQDRSAGPDPLVMLAHGDSWFDYPLNGNELSINSTDVIAQLESMGNLNPLISNVSHYGDATSDEMSWPKQQRMIDSLQDPANWLEKGKPDAILFSGGGNDIAGNQFCIFLDYAAPGAGGLDATRFQEALEMVKASYEDLFVFRDRNASGVPIFGHCYDFPIPNGVHPVCAGPWLLPSLTFTGWNTAQGVGILHAALSAFKLMLLDLANVPVNNFHLIDTQNTLEPSDWANELHPYPEGFRKLAQRFVEVLRTTFGSSRI